MSAEPVPHNHWELRPEYADSVLDVLGRQWPAQGAQVAALEAELADRFRPDGACAVVSSGSAALYLAMLHSPPHLRLPTYACSALLNAARLAKIGVGIVDCDPGSLDSAGADIVVHTYGRPCGGVLGAMQIEDFTHAPGATFRGRPCGSLGIFSVISFGATKPLGVGMGGAVLGPVGAIGEIRARRDYDDSHYGNAFNFQLGDVYAGMVRARLRRLSEENQWRRETAERYREVYRQRIYDVGDGGVWYRFVIRVPDWYEAQEWFDRWEVCTINPLRPGELMHRRLGGDRDRFPNAEAAAAKTLSLPIWPGMTEKQVGRVVEVLAEFPA